MDVDGSAHQSLERLSKHPSCSSPRLLETGWLRLLAGADEMKGGLQRMQQATMQPTLALKRIRAGIENPRLRYQSIIRSLGIRTLMSR